MGSRSAPPLHFVPASQSTEYLLRKTGSSLTRDTSRADSLEDVGRGQGGGAEANHQALSEIRELFRKHGVENVTSDAVKQYCRIVRDWALTDDQSSGLIGVAPEDWEHFKTGDWAGTFSDDQLLRISAIFGTYLALRASFNQEQIRGWLKAQHWSPQFEGKSPICLMLDGGMESIFQTRRYAEAIKFGM